VLIFIIAGLLGVTEGVGDFTGERDAAGGSVEQGEEQVHQTQGCSQSCY
jgi:hypothetical protein